MKKQEYIQLRKEVFELVIEESKVIYEGDEEFIAELWEGLLKDFEALPKHRETIRTLKGIVGFREFLKQNARKEGVLLHNALHDLSECCKNYLADWFSPRLGRYASYVEIVPIYPANQFEKELLANKVQIEELKTVDNKVREAVGYKDEKRLVWNELGKCFFNTIAMPENNLKFNDITPTTNEEN